MVLKSEVIASLGKRDYSSVFGRCFLFNLTSLGAPSRDNEVVRFRKICRVI